MIVIIIIIIIIIINDDSNNNHDNNNDSNNNNNRNNNDSNNNNHHNKTNHTKNNCTKYVTRAIKRANHHISYQIVDWYIISFFTISYIHYYKNTRLCIYIYSDAKRAPRQLLGEEHSSRALEASLVVVILERLLVGLTDVRSF